jgi:tetratricopeptide (TPR) repeat protein
LALVYLVSAVFWPVLRFEFVHYDAHQQLLNNPRVQNLTAENLKHIFTSRCVTSYYPVRTLTFALDYQLWGHHAGGFKLANCLIHLTNVLLVFWLVLRLSRQAGSVGRSPGWWDVCAATFSAGVFAVHPVVVEPAVWVPGREELLMTLGALGCFHFHITGRRLSESGAAAPVVIASHAGAGVCCAVACLSNAVGAVIPLLITTWDLLTLAGAKSRTGDNDSVDRPRVKPSPARARGECANDSITSSKFRRILYATSALWVIGVVTIVIKQLGPEPEIAVDRGGTFLFQQAGLVLSVYWLNLRTLVWPTRLAIEYPGINPHGFLDPGVVAGAIAVGATGAVLWLLRRHRLALFGVLWFCLALGPTSQIMPHHIHRADRFLYLPVAGLALAIGMGVLWLAGAIKERKLSTGATAMTVVLGLVVLFGLVVVSSRQVQTWRDERAMWEQCLMVNPHSARAHGGLADQLAVAGQFDQAVQHYRAVAQLAPDDPEMLDIVALQLASFQDERFRDYDEAIRLASRACELSGWDDPKYIRGLAAVHTLLGRSLADRGDFRAAIKNFGKALDLDAEFVPALRNLATLLAACPEQELRDYDLATNLAERACDLTERSDPFLIMVVAEIHALAGRRDMAVTAAEEAIGLAQGAGDVDLADKLRRRLQELQNGLPTESAAP